MLKPRLAIVFYVETEFTWKDFSSSMKVTVHGITTEIRRKEYLMRPMSYYQYESWVNLKSSVVRPPRQRDQSGRYLRFQQGYEEK